MTPIRTVAFDARYVNDQYHGIGRHAFHILEALSRLDSGRHYVAFYHPAYRNTRFPLETLAKRSNITLTPISMRLYSPYEQILWLRYLAHAHADIFHTPYVVLPVLAPIRLVMTVQDLILEQHPEYRPKGVLQRLYSPVVRAGVVRASKLLAGSEATSREILSYYRVAPDRIKVIGNAVDPTFHRVVDTSRLASVRERYRLPERFILTVGAGRPHKNVETLVEAYARLGPNQAPHLVIGGEPDPRFPDTVGAHIQKHRLAKHVLRLGRIEEEDLPAIYTLADVFVFPSLVEGFGLPPIEAMACGTPVVSSSTPAVAEAVGDAALQFNPLDPSALALALYRALTDASLRATLQQRGYTRARELNWDRVAKAALEAYASLEVSARRTKEESVRLPSKPR